MYITSNEILKNNRNFRFVMSVIYKTDVGFFISHPVFIENVYGDVEYEGVRKKFRYKKDLFKIKFPFKNTKENEKRKRRRELEANERLEAFQIEVRHVEEMFKIFRLSIIGNKISTEVTEEKYVKFSTGVNYSSNITDERNFQKKSLNENKEALLLSTLVYDKAKKVSLSNSFGENKNDCKVIEIDREKYFFPSNCRFFCKDVKDIGKNLRGEKFDVILLDPPWWNKYIRRKKLKSDKAYSMIYDCELASIPIGEFLEDDGFVVVWCTNSTQHFDKLVSEIFPSWGVSFAGKWYWIKVTEEMIPVCEFSEPPRKQPFEQIIFGFRNKRRKIEKKLILSIPSALHSHKPPLNELLEHFFGAQGKRLEIFARYLLPNWTSYGLEATLLQHDCLFEENV